MIARKVDIKSLKNKRDELESEIKSNHKYFRACVDYINRQMCEIEELESELSTMKADVENLKKSTKELVEFNKSDEENLKSVIDRLNVAMGKEPEYIKPFNKIRPDCEMSICTFA